MSKTDEAMQMLDQLQDALGKLERNPDRMPTNRALLVIARVVYWLVEQWIREHQGYCFECREWQKEERNNNGK